jgi:hypothetical protein
MQPLEDSLRICYHIVLAVSRIKKDYLCRSLLRFNFSIAKTSVVDPDPH